MPPPIPRERQARVGDICPRTMLVRVGFLPKAARGKLVQGMQTPLRKTGFGLCWHYRDFEMAWGAMKVRAEGDRRSPNRATSHRANHRMSGVRSSATMPIAAPAIERSQIRRTRLNRRTAKIRSNPSVTQEAQLPDSAAAIAPQTTIPPEAIQRVRGAFGISFVKSKWCFVMPCAISQLFHTTALPLGPTSERYDHCSDTN